jgi:PhoPQ-activated pathogenicity-related protein
MPTSMQQNLASLRLAVLACGAASAVAGCVAPPSGPSSRASDQPARLAQAPLQPAPLQPAPLQPAPLQPAQSVKAPTSIPNLLDTYIARPEPAFAWREEKRQGNTVELRVTSQTWQGAPWTHRVEIARPQRNAVPGAALMVINFGSGSAGESFVAQLAANVTGATVVNAFNVPNQPLWGKREDDLIAHTFVKYLESDDANSDWPLLLPMTKSATQIMRAVEEWSRAESAKTAGAPEPSAAITRWGVSGASKRGWTTWLVAASQAKLKPGRVIGIAPLVYDNLDLARQMPHQKASWGDYSEQIADYARRGLPDLVATPRGQRLAAIVDPWTYRERLDLPKLIVNGTNDRYWPLDAFNLYREGLTGPTNVFYAPNSGHMLNGNEARVAGITATWFKQVAQGQTPPQVLASVLDARNNPVVVAGGAALNANAGRKWRLTVSRSDNKKGAVALRSARLWHASSPTRDFRSARWRSIDLPVGGAQEIALDDERLKGEGKYLALFGEIELPGGVGDGDEAAPSLPGLGPLKIPFALSSPVTIWEK